MVAIIPLEVEAKAVVYCIFRFAMAVLPLAALSHLVSEGAVGELEVGFVPLAASALGKALLLLTREEEEVP